MRIIAGRHRGRRLVVPPGTAIRPTLERVREAVFNVLAHGIAWGGFAGAEVIDLFAGAGAYGLEALSRGAAHVWFVDADGTALAAVRANAAAIGAADRVTLLRADATTLPPRRGGRPATLAFLDPPYGRGLAAPALSALAAGGWLAAGAIVVVETGRGEGLTPPAGYTAEDERIWGAARARFLRWR